jgi:hypothetical protein
MQREYAAFFEANEHGGYTVTVLALPGLATVWCRMARSVPKNIK